jgi:hypothetical protein
MDTFNVGREDQAFPLKAAIFGCPLLPRVGPSAPETQLGYGLPPIKSCRATIWMRRTSGDQGVKRRPVAAL